MTMNRALNAGFFVLATLSLTIGVGPADAEERSLAHMLQSMPPEFDRQGLEPEVVFQRQDGVSAPGVRCATRPVASVTRVGLADAVPQAIGDLCLRHQWPGVCCAVGCIDRDFVCIGGKAGPSLAHVIANK